MRKIFISLTISCVLSLFLLIRPVDSIAQYTQAINITIDQMDASIDGENWSPLISKSTTIDILGSNATSRDGYSVEIDPLPVGSYKYVRLYISGIESTDGVSENDLLPQLRMLSDTNFDPMYFSYNGSINISGYGTSSIFYNHKFKVGTLMPFTVSENTNLAIYYIVPADFVTNGQITCIPKLIIQPESNSDISSLDIGTISGSVSPIYSGSNSVFVGAYENFATDVAPNFFVKATNNGDGTADYSLSVTKGTYQVIAIEDINGDMNTTTYPSGKDRLYANGDIPNGIINTSVNAGEIYTEDLIFSDTLENIEGYGGTVGSSVAKLYVYAYELKGLAIDINTSILFLEVYPVINGNKSDTPLRVDIGDISALLDAVNSDSMYTYTFPNMPTGSFYFYVHLDTNGNGIRDPGDFTANPIRYDSFPEGGASYVPYTVSEGGTLENPVDLNASYPMYIKWTNNTIPFADGSNGDRLNCSTYDVAHGAYAVGDFNNDGNLDIVTGADFTCNEHYDPDKIGIHFGNGDGTFKSRVDYETGINIVSIASSDFNKDGNIDIITFTGEQGDELGKINVHINNGTGEFNTKASYTISSGIIRWEVGMHVADVNNDGNEDIITYSEWASGGIGSYTDICRISIILGNGDGTFQTAVNYDVPEGITSVRSGDLDADGDIDLVTTSRYCGFYGANKIGILINNGDGIFAPVVQYDHEYGGLSDLTIADVNSDNNLDVITVSFGGIGIYLGNGDGTIQSPNYYETLYNPSTILVDDFNADSKLDFIVGTISDGLAGIFVHIGAGDGTVPSGTKYPPPSQTDNLQKHDINNDGKADLVWTISGIYRWEGDYWEGAWVGITLGK